MGPGVTPGRRIKLAMIAGMGKLIMPPPRTTLCSWSTRTRDATTHSRTPMQPQRLPIRKANSTRRATKSLQPSPFKTKFSQMPARRALWVHTKPRIPTREILSPQPITPIISMVNQVRFKTAIILTSEIIQQPRLAGTQRLPNRFQETTIIQQIFCQSTMPPINRPKTYNPMAESWTPPLQWN